MNKARATLSGLPAAMWVVVALAIAFCLFIPRFASLGNAENVLRIAAILAIAASGQAIVLIIAGIDFSTGASVALVSVVTVMALQAWDPLTSIGLGLLAAIALGVVNSVLIARVGVAPFIGTLGTSLAAGSLASYLVGGMPMDPTPSQSFYWLGRGHIAGVPVPIVVAGCTLAALHGLLAHSVLGRRLALLGTNREAARLAGLPVQKDIALAYVLCGVLTAVAGAVLTSRVASGQPMLFPTLPFESIAACAVGGMSLAGGRGNAMQVLAGVLIIAMLNNAVTLLNWPAALQQLGIAAIIVGAVVAQSQGAGLRRRWARTTAPGAKRVEAQT